MTATATQGRPALRPAPADEWTHAPGPEALWNESWYFDAISADGSLGVFHRIGRLPNRDACWITTCVARPGEPTAMIVEEAALSDSADETQAVAADRVRASHDFRRPLESAAISVAGAGEAHADHSAPLRGERGDSTAIDLDLRWETDGIPYRWRHSDRYEIPCRVSGTVRVGDQGQRDHSWGARDWWASDWVWSALHLDDGTHLHHVSVPGHPRFAVGYVQRDGELTEIKRARCGSRIAGDGLIAGATLALEPSEPRPRLELEAEPLAFGAVRLTSEEGHLSHFPRAMCRISSGDGRAGLGWIEWNRNQRQPDNHNQENR